MRFEYVFASEEYPEFVCSPYNDVFGFFISGPNPAGGVYTNKNIATVPNTTTPVFINSVNTGTSGTYSGTTWNSANCQALNYTNYYVNNLNPVNQNIVYDGMTVVLPATAKVVPCQTYHLKLAIADVGDRIYDSGVFLKAYSFTSSAVTVSASAQLDYAGFTSAYEGCVGGTFTVTTSTMQTVDDTIDVTVTGTATNGTDYTSIPTQVIIPAGQTSVSIPLTPLVDGIAEIGETVTVTVLNPCSGLPISSAALTIEDNIPISVSVNDSLLCVGQSARLTATGGLAYDWAPASTLSSTNTNSTTATPTSNTNYTVTVLFGGCTQTLSQMLYVSNPAVAVAASGISCNGNPATINSTVTNAIAPVSYLWSNGTSAATIAANTAGAYTLTITDAYGCSANASATVSTASLLITTSANNVSCYGGNNGSATIAVSGGTLPYTYTWSNGAQSASVNNLTQGVYNVTAADANGCSATAAITVSQPASSLNALATAIAVSCNSGSDGSVNLQINEGTAPYTYHWDNNAATQNLQNVALGNYTVTVTDANSCSVTAQAAVTQPVAGLSIAATPTNVACYGGNTGSVAIAVNGGTTPYNFLWNTGGTSSNPSNMIAGSYAVTVTDANGCSATQSVLLTQPSALLSVALTSNAIACFGNATGSVVSNASGGIAPYNFVWNNNAISNSLLNVVAGNYSVTVTDANLCLVTASTTVSQPSAALSASVATIAVSCYGGSNGSVNLTAHGGTTPYTYHWNNNAVTEDLQNLTTGIYTVTITDANKCSVTTSASITEPVAALNISATPTNVACFGNNTGSVATIVSGGTNPYSFLWNTGGTAQSPVNMSAGSYTVTVTDANGCSAAKNVSIAQPSASLSASLTTGAVACYGASTGFVTSAVSGGTSPYNFIWNNNATTASVTNLTAGSYSLTVTDANSCTVTANTVINQPTVALTTSVVINAVSCYGGSNGSVNLTANVGTTPYSYQWNNNSVTEDIQNLTTGTYQVTITDANNCSATTQASVTQPAAVLTVSAIPTNVACYGNSSGSVTAAVSGGTTPYNYLWSTGESTSNISGISVGNYVVTVVDANGCSAMNSVVVTQPSAALSTTLTPNEVACYGNSTGSVTSNTSGGTAPYSFVWSNNSNSANISSVSAGSYSLTVTDANSCSVAVSGFVAEPTAALNTSVTTLEVSCYGGNNGSVNATANGGTMPYSYLWSNGSAAQTLQNVSSGSYQITVTDAHDCSVTQQAHVTQPAAPVYAVTSVDSVSCFGGNNGGAIASVIGGTPPYSFAWSNSQTTQNLTSVVAGNYSVTVTDSKSCTTTISAYIAQPTAPLQVMSAKTDVSCYGSHDGEVSLTANGGTPPYFFEWSNNSAQQNQTGLVAGVYVVTATDINGCSVTGNNQVNQPAPLALTTSYTNVLCYGSATGGAQVNVSGGTPGYTFTWSNGKSTSIISNITAGSYTVTVNDNNQCSASAALAVSQPAAGINASAYVKHVSCKGGSDGAVFLTVSGGTSPFTYHWSNAAVTQHVQNLVTGSYTVTIIDGNGCQFVLTNVIAEPSALTLSESHSSVKCYGGNNGAAQLIATGGTAPYTYYWSNGSNVPVSQNLIAGSYFVTVNDAHQCSATASFGIGQPQPLTLSLNHTNAICFGSATGSIQATINGGTPLYTYQWSNGSQATSLSGVGAGSYTLTVTDGNGCSLAASRTIQQPTAITVIETHTAPSCFGSASGSIDVTVSGGNPAYTYSWSNGATSQDILNVVAGTYVVTIKDNNNCTVSKTIVVTQPAPVTLTETHTIPSCNGYSNGAITANASGGTPAYQYFWSNGSNNSQVSNLGAGTYGVTVVDANGCGAALAAILLTQPDSVLVALTSTDVKCSETATGAVVSSVTGGTQPYSFQWSNASASSSIQSIEAGVYSLTVTDANGCSAASTAMVNDVPPLVIKGVGDSVPCSVAKGIVTLWVDGGVAPYLFHWSNGATTQNLNQVTAGTYSVTVTDANGCEIDTVLFVENLNQFTVDASGGGTVTLGQTVELHAISTGSSVTTYQWTPSQGIVCPTCANTTSIPTRFTIYTVVATDTNGCFAQDTVPADVIEDYTVFTPNAFTPNGDGNNDYFEFYGNAAGLKHINIMIFDRWGEKMYEADEPTFKWDGMYKGELVAPGVYVYVLKLVFINGHAERIHKGSLTVIR